MNVLQSCRWSRQWQLSGELYERVLPAICSQAFMNIAPRPSGKLDKR
jgi:hypothetical protein